MTVLMCSLPPPFAASAAANWGEQWAANFALSKLDLRILFLLKTKSFFFFFFFLFYSSCKAGLAAKTSLQTGNYFWCRCPTAAAAATNSSNSGNVAAAPPAAAAAAESCLGSH